MSRNTWLLGAALCALATYACGDDDGSPGGDGDIDASADVGGDTEVDGTPDMLPDTRDDVTADADTGVDTGSDLDAALADVDLAEDVDAGRDADLGGGGTELATVLSGGQEAPAVETDAFGSGVFVLSDDQSEIDFTIEVDDITDVTNAHIHWGPLGVSGPILFPLPGATEFSSPLSGTLTEANFTAAAAVGIDTYEDAVAAVLAGDTYVNVHTTGNPAGEVRGQVGGLVFGAVLTGGQEAPTPIVTEANGTATFALSADFTSIEFTVTVDDIANVTNAHIHIGGLGTPGSVLFPLPGATEFSSPLTGELRAEDFTEAATEGISSYQEALAVILEGNTYVNVHTTENVPGEVRGQIGAVRLSADLDPDQEVDEIDSDGTGTGTVLLSADQQSLRYTLSVADLSSDVMAAHIHLAPVDTNGDILFGLGNATDLNSGDILGILDDGDFMAIEEDGVTSMDDAINALLTGGTYFNIHTVNNGGGEIRGQILP